MSFLTQNDFIDVVVQYIRDNGVAYWDDLRKVIERNFELSSEDLEPLGSYEHRYLSNLLNLKSNKTMIRRYQDIVQIRGGFATKKFAEENNLYITDDGVGLVDHGPRVKSKKPRITRDAVLKVLVEYYQGVKSTLSAKTIDALRKNRDNIINAVLAANPTENEVRSLVVEQFNQY